MPEATAADRSPFTIQYTAATVLGVVAGCTTSILFDRLGEGFLVVCIPPPLLGIPAGLLARAAVPLCVMAFYLSGLVTAGILGHLNLLPCAMFFFIVPTLLFGASAMGSWLLLRWCLPRTRLPSP
jgi:hypothetical protein